MPDNKKHKEFDDEEEAGLVIQTFQMNHHTWSKSFNSPWRKLNNPIYEKTHKQTLMSQNSEPQQN